MEDSIRFIQPILKGKVIINPKYREQYIDEYKGNPCIEALPPILNDEKVVKKLSKYIFPSDKEKELNGNVRYHILQRIKSYYQPMDNHLKIEQMLSCLIRRSYISRNPNSKEYLLRLRLILEVIEEQEFNKDSYGLKLCEKLTSKLRTIPETCRSTAECFSIIGISGMGKSTAVEKLLLLYPQVIIHSLYKGKPLIRTQITWLKIDCPFDGSLKTLCKMFFKAVDDILLTTNYFSRYGNNRNSTSTMMIHMSHLACLHSIGVLVIDEMQHLINPKNTPDEILNFLVTLVNTIGISVIQIGTPKVTTVLDKGLRQVRRAEEAGSISWDRMQEGDEWDFFIENLCDCQWVKVFRPIDKELKSTMYHETQGITSIAISLFILVQAEAIYNEEEQITVKLIHFVAKNRLKLTHKIIDAIRSGEKGKMKNYEDISITVEEVLEDKLRKSERKKRIEELSKQQKKSMYNGNYNLKEQIIGELISMGLFVNVDYNMLENLVEEIVKQGTSSENLSTVKQNIIKAAMLLEEGITRDKEQKKSVKNKKEILESQDLRYLFKKSEKDKVHVYELLKHNSYIKDPLEEFYI